jgi:TPP-dependent pyruvate/acetoin dehydrogenase alpha subunit
MRLGYRTETEVDEWRRRDPVDAWRARLIGSGHLEAELDAVDTAILAELDAATEFARASAWPEAADVMNYMYDDQAAAGHVR